MNEFPCVFRNIVVFQFHFRMPAAAAVVNLVICTTMGEPSLPPTFTTQYMNSRVLVGC